MSELRSRVKVEVAVLGNPSLIVLMVSVNVKEHRTCITELRSCVKDEVASPGLPVPNGRCGLCGHKATVNLKKEKRKKKRKKAIS